MSPREIFSTAQEAARRAQPNEADRALIALRDPNCEATPRMVAESMHDDDFAALAAAAAGAEDEP